jgi:hypothetical protein
MPAASVCNTLWGALRGCRISWDVSDYFALSIAVD